MSDKKSIREFIDNEIHLLWNQYHNYDIDCKLSVKKEFFTNDIIDGYEILKEIVQESVVEEELNNKYIYHVLNDDEDYIIVRTFNNSSLLKAITENKVNYPEGVEINSIEDLFLSEIWHAGGLTYFFDDGIEYEWFCRCEY